MLLLFLVGASSGSAIDAVIMGALAGVAAGTVAIAFERTRPYAVGFLLGLAIIVVVGAGACVGILAMITTTY